MAATRRPSGRPRPPGRTDAERVLDTGEASLLDIVDNVLNKGVVLTGDLTIGLANVDLVYARLSLLLCAADRVLPDAARRAGPDRPQEPRGRIRRARPDRRTLRQPGGRTRRGARA